MLVSKNGKRFMAWIMAMAFVLSGMAFVPKTASVAEAAEGPTAKVLGATLRLDKEGVDNNGTQSMRIGIQVDNADQAKGCAIKLSLGNDKTCIIGTDSAKPSYVKENEKYISNPRLYSKEGNTVIYAVVVTGINEENFGSEITVEAIADNGEGTPEFVQGNEKKSVNGIVDKLKTQFHDLGIFMAGGVLFAGEDKLTARDISGYADSTDSPGLNTNPGGIGWSSDGTEYTIPLVEGETILNNVDNDSKTVITSNEDGSVTSSTTKNEDGFGIAPPKEIKNLPLSKAEIYYSDVQGSYTRSHFYIKSDGGEDHLYGQDNSAFGKADKVQVCNLDPLKTLDYIKCWANTVSDAPEDAVKASVTITKVVFTVDKSESAPGEPGIKLTEAKTVEGTELEQNSSGDITAITGKNITGIYIPLPSDVSVSNGDSVNVTVYGDCSDDSPRICLSNGVNPCSQITEQMEFKKSYILTANADNATHLMIKSHADDTPCTMTITKVVIEKAKSLDEIEQHKMDLSLCVSEFGNPKVTQPGDDGSVVFTCDGTGGVIFTDIPDDTGYNWITITYTKSGGDINAYPSNGNDAQLKLENTEEERTVCLPKIDGKSNGVKIFNYNSSDANLTIKSIRLYKEDPSNAVASGI